MIADVTEADLARDLAADLALCEAAPPGPWLDLFAGSNGLQRYVAPAGWRGLPVLPVLYSYCPPHAALDMACAAREGWPAAIRLALHWQAEAERLRAEVGRLTPKYGPCGMRHHGDDCDCDGMGGDR